MKLLHIPPFVTLVVILLFPNLSTILEAHPGWGIVVDRKGQIYFSDVNRDIIWKIDSRGSVTKFVRGKHSHDLRIDKEDNIYGEHVWYDQKGQLFHSSFWKASPDGRIEEIMPEEGKNVFRVVDSKGNEYRGEGNAHTRQSRLVKVQPDGNVVLFAGGIWGYSDGNGADAKFRSYGVMLLGPDSALYITEGGTVRRISLDGTVATLAGPRDGFGDREVDEPQASSFLGLALDSRMNVYAANWNKKKVIRVSRDGTITTLLDSAPFWSPSGVTVVGGNVYVLEHRSGVTILLEKTGLGGPRVRKISRDGKITCTGTAP